jgi:hypothetical protein
VVVGVETAECEVTVEVREHHNLGSVVVTVELEREATYSAEEIHMDCLLVEGSLRQELDLETSPFDLVSWNLGVFLASVSEQWGSVGVELAINLEHSSCAVVLDETLLIAGHYSAMCGGTEVPV